MTMNSFPVYPDDHLVRLRLLQRYMSAGIMSLVISKGGFIVSLLLLATSGPFIVGGRFFFWERHQLYGCQVDYPTSITSHICSSDWQQHACGSVDSSTMTCLVSGTIALFVAVAYPYALLAIKGNRALPTVCGLPLDGSLCSGHSSRISIPRHRFLLGLGQYSAHPFADDPVIAPRSHL